MSYILIILAVLVLLNTYPLLVSQSLVFRTKETAMKSSVKMVESALSGLPELTEENVGQALASVEETGVSRLLVTDTSGRILFDTREGGSAKGMYAMYTEIVQALDGSDAFYCRYDSHAFLSRGASPVVYRNRIIGAVYAYQYDTQQAELLQSFQTNLTRISLLIGVLVVALSALLSRAFTRKIRELLQAIRQVREGAYSHRASVRGNDEIAQLAQEFNSLTDRLQTTENARRRFVSDASHELRTPVAVILAECDSLDHGQPTEEDYRQSVDVIRRQGQQMSRLIGQLLHITRLEQGTQKLQLETADLSQLVEVLCEEQAHLAPEGITLAVHTQPDLLVNGDVTRLSRLLTNLISNAYRYGKPNGHVWVDLRREGQWAVLSVRDDGSGIAPEDRERIFQRFYQVDAARGKDGSGLGLFMVQQAARLHGGSVTVDSRIGEGSTFIVRLPLAE